MKVVVEAKDARSHKTSRLSTIGEFAKSNAVLSSLWLSREKRAKYGLGAKETTSVSDMDPTRTFDFHNQLKVNPLF